ncbi:mechanosensitive ion channel family protein [Candidatus Woesearchaeota archaeon]|nr:mechanosensitive ion channel family protein [Candidatus Woesearchaeota archaeon]
MSFLTNIYFDNTVIHYAVFILIIGLSVIIAKIIYWIIQNVIKIVVQKSKTRLDDIILDMVEEPVVVFIVLLGVKIAWTFLKFPNFPKIPVYFDHLVYMVLVLNTAWLIARLITSLIDNYLRPITAETENDLDDHILPIISKLTNILIFAIAIIMVLNNFGQEIGPLLTGLGIGGLAFALAAKDILENLFGSITILSDKSFAIGQRIRIGGHDGTVQEIGLRTTKIQTLDGTIIYVPNSKFTASILENVSKEWARKIKMTIGLTYDTDVKKMKKAKEIITKILEKQDGIDKEKINVFFTDFNAYSKDILVIYWITDKERILDIKDEVNMKFMEQLEKAKIEMAFPTQTIELKK